MLVDSKKVSPKRVEGLSREANEILTMTVASIKTLRAGDRDNPKSKIENPKFGQDLMSRAWNAARPMRKVVIEKAVSTLKDSAMRGQGIGCA